MYVIIDFVKVNKVENIYEYLKYWSNT